MKKTLTVNLGGTVYNIDEDAYQLLDRYLRNLRSHFQKEEGGKEIVDDMEARISEIFSEEISNSQQVIDITLAEKVIKRLGNPEEIEGDLDEEEPKKERTSNRSHENVEKRLYRNPNDKIIGGVASGLAAYLGWDVTLVRIGLVLILIFGYGFTFFLYLLLWIIVPEARSATDKLKMKGETVTVENIGKVVTDSCEKVTDYVKSKESRSFLRKLADGFVQVIGFILKFIFIMIAIILSPVLLLLVVGLFVMIIALIVSILGGGAFILTTLPELSVNLPAVGISPLATISLVICGIFAVGIPLFSFIYVLLSQKFKWKTFSKWLVWALIIWWILCVVVTLIGWPAMACALPL